MNIAIVGKGRVGTTLALAFERCGHCVVTAAGRSFEAAQQAVDGAELTFLTVSDDAVESVAGRIRWRDGIGVVHCSGVLDLHVLDTAAKLGARTASFHPLQMFADVESALRHLPDTTVVLAGDRSLLDELESLVRQVHATPLRLNIQNRALYHASVNYAGPFVIALLREAAKLWNHLGFSEEAALRALIPLIRGTLTGVDAAGLAGGMGGSVARGDTHTIERHLHAIAETAPEQLDLYKVLCARTIPLALERGTLQPETAERIARLLAEESHEH